MYEYRNGQVINAVTGWDPVMGLHGIPLKAGIYVPQDAEDTLRAARTPRPSKKALQDASIGAATEGLRFLTARELAEMTPEEPDWIWESFVTVGGITMIIGKIKAAGKTTLVTHACRSILDGSPFLGYPTKKTGVMYLTEQSNESFREHLRRANLLNRDDFFFLPWHSTKGVSWTNVVDMAVEEAKKRDLKLLVVDTLSRHANLEGDSENNAGDAMKAMKPLKFAAGEGFGVAVIGHERKSGGNVGDAGRGSSAFGGEVDIIASIKRPEGNARPTIREIHTLSRFDQTPEKLVVDLTDKGYRAFGSDAAVAELEARQAILRVLPGTEDGAMTLEELLAEVKEDGVNRTTAQNAIKEMLEQVVFQVGEGVKGDPYRYWQPDGDLHKSSEASNQDTSVDTAADPAISTVFDEGDNSIDENDGGATEESVQGMLATLESEDDIRHSRIFEAVREYREHPLKPFRGMTGKELKQMIKHLTDTGYGRYLKEPLDFEPTSEEVTKASREYVEEKEKLDGPWVD